LTSFYYIFQSIADLDKLLEDDYHAVSVFSVTGLFLRTPLNHFETNAVDAGGLPSYITGDRT